jgi:nitroreductase
LFEAARWAASCVNEQPWRFITATRDNADAFARVLSLLAPKNQDWARTAWLIGFTAGKRTFTYKGAPNPYLLHDVGAASACLALQATASGLQAHYMGGFDRDRARTEFDVPEDFEIGAAFAAGYVADGVTAPPTRTRKPLSSIVFGTDWEQAAGFAADL